MIPVKTKLVLPPADETSSGASEMIGAVLMITIVVAAIALVSVILFSQSPPQEIPNINFMTGSNGPGDLIYLYHNGGDALKREQFAVVIDNDPPRTDYSISDESDEWSVGKSLILERNPARVPEVVSLVYYDSNGGTLILRSSASSIARQNSIGPSDIPPVPGGGSSGGSGFIFNDPYNITNSSYFIQAIEQNISAHRVSFFRDPFSGQGLVENMELSFTVTDTESKSLIIYDTTTVKLNKSEKITVTTRNTNNFELFGIAPQIWELSADKAHLRIDRTAAPTLDLPNVRISHTWINRYDPYTLESDLTINTGTRPNSAVSLIVNNTAIPVGSSTVNIVGARPLPIGLYSLSIDNSRSAVHFVGVADQVCVGSNCGPFGV